MRRGRAFRRSSIGNTGRMARPVFRVAHIPNTQMPIRKASFKDRSPVEENARLVSHNVSSKRATNGFSPNQQNQGVTPRLGKPIREQSVQEIQPAGENQDEHNLHRREVQSESRIVSKIVPPLMAGPHENHLQKCDESQ